MLRFRFAGETGFELCEKIHNSWIEYKFAAVTIFFRATAVRKPLAAA
jgi:hypothetical protein